MTGSASTLGDRAIAAIEWIRSEIVSGIGLAIQGPPPLSRQIAFIGTSGCGKTVFLAAIAREIQMRVDQGWLLDPRTGATELYVEDIRDQLQRGDWPPSTPPSTMHEMSWVLRCPPDIAAETRVVDFGGQDFRTLFMGDLANIPPELRPLAEYCRRADVIVLLINVRDFEGEQNAAMRTGSELSLKFALDHARTGGVQKHCCAVFTQADLYPNLAEECGGWYAVARKYLPRLWGAHLQPDALPVFAVSAVDRTETRPDRHGVLRRFPAAEFTAAGFDPFLSWLQATLMRLRDDAWGNALKYRMQSLIRPLLLCLVLIGGCSASYWTVSSTIAWTKESLRIKRPIPQKVYETKKIVDTNGLIDVDYKFEVRVHVLNKGASGPIKLRVVASQGAWTESKVVERVVAAGQIDPDFWYHSPWLPDRENFQITASFVE
jgi:GTPase SAR1 family protein